jgi:hypothetical protein
MLALQDHKKKLADHSLGEGTGEKLRNLGVEEIKMLFGMNTGQGHPGSHRDHPSHTWMQRPIQGQFGTLRAGGQGATPTHAAIGLLAPSNAAAVRF